MQYLSIRFRPKGQNLTEVTLVMGLVVIVAVASMSSLGANVSNLFGNMITKRTNTDDIQPDVGGGNGTPNPGQQINLPAGLIPFPNEPGKVMTFTYQGLPLQINIADPGAILNESTGSNGLINQTRNGTLALQQLISQLENAPSPPTEQIEMLKKLAKKGQQISTLQRIVKDNLPANFDSLAEADKLLVLRNTKVDISSVRPGETDASLLTAMSNLSYAMFTNSNSIFERDFECGTKATRCNVTPNVVMFDFLDTLSQFNVNTYTDSAENPEKRADNAALQSLVNGIFAKMIFFSAGRTADEQTQQTRDQLIQSTVTNTTNICNVGNVVSCQSRG